MRIEVMTGELPQASPAGVVAPPGPLPPLENGDRLTRSDFEQRYDAMPHVKKAELIEGIVYMPSPVRVRSHGKPHGQIMGWIGMYSAATPGVDFADNTTLRLDPDNEPQPDAMLWIDAAAGGHARVSDDDYLEGSPELIVEVAASSASYDLHVKREVYRRALLELERYIHMKPQTRRERLYGFAHPVMPSSYSDPTPDGGD